MKEPLVWLAAILMFVGTVTLALLLDSATVAPPEGAGANKLTMQVETPGAFTVPGEQLRLLGTTVTATVRLTVVDWLRLSSVAVTVADWLLLMVPLEAVNVALLCPFGTIALAGTAKIGLPLLIETTASPEVALLSETVQVVVALLARLDGEHDTDVNCAKPLMLIVKLWTPPFRLAVSSTD
jgi:hypothetical protein